MLNSIFRRWLVVSLSITITILLILTVTVSWLVQRDYYRQGLKQLNERAESVELAYEEFSQGDLQAADFRKELRRIEKENHVSITILGKKMKVLKQELYEVGVRPDIRSWVTSVSEGNRVEEIEKFRNQDDTKMLIVGFPLKKDNRIVASAFIYSPAADVKQLAAPIRRSIWLVAIACAGPLIILLWFAIRRIAGPIQKMSEAAMAVANGEFASRVEIHGKDEVARLGASFNMMAERMERVEERRRRLIMEIAHELRTPLTSIRGTLQALTDGILTNEEQSEFIALSLQESLRLGKLIDQIHELSAFEEHQIQFEFKRIDMTELTDQTVLQFKHKAESQGIQLQFVSNKHTPIILKADPVRLRQAIINLIGNALDHNQQGTTVTVQLAADQQKVKLIVQDNGQGISAEHIPHIFDRLYKADDSRSSKGSGLGLTITRYIVQAHQGTIRAVPERGKGTEMHVELPLNRT
ncbi:ATP-binding protein [Paenibacillus solisilvae]|uniref:histidine kinase n=1 Tax=Paenibacillus solisilvae TaxID=2486751 RepID=A0ABW0W1W9_9BACL